jgi:CheY-like chemotaxis protein
MGGPIDLATDLGSSLRSVRADRAQIEQILWNLALNARDAMPNGGRLTLRTRNLFLGHVDACRLGFKEGDYVELTVADTGFGIDAGVQAHLFEPFFTTKQRGRTGLGLASVHGIVKQSGGHITVESEPGRGTTFVIYFPATAQTAACHDVPEPPADGGRETVLLVEDDGGVRGLISDVLRRRGYRLLVADSALRAIELVSAHPGAIDLLITDVGMPGLIGQAVADAMRVTHGGVKVLYVSGYTDDVVMPDGFTETTGAFLHKPFTPDALARKVRAVLSA